MSAAIKMPDTVMQKVLFVIRTRGFGGLEILLLDWMASIDYSTTTVVLASAQTELFSQKVAESGLPVQCIDLPHSDQGRLWRALPNWMSLFSSVRPDRIILLEGKAPDFDLAPFVAAYFSRKGKLFVFEATAPDPMRKSKPRLHFGFVPGIGLWWHKRRWNVKIRGYLAKQTLTASQGTRDRLIAHYGYSSRKSSVLHHGVDTQRFCPSRTARSEFRRAHGIPEDAVVIVSHGRLDRNKRVDRIIHAFQTLSAKHQNLWLLLTAHGPIKDEIEQAVTQLGGENRRVKLIEFQEDVSKLVQASDIYVLASNNEGFGIALVEAMATGLLCVATDVSGPGDFVVDGHNGFLVEESDLGVLNGIRRALELEDSEKEAIRRQARSTVVEKFDLRRAVRTALEVFQIARR